MRDRNIFVDLDGTLIDIAPRHYRVYTQSIHHFGGEPLAFDRYWTLKRDNASWNNLLSLSSLSPEVKKDFLQFFAKQIESPEELAHDRLFIDALTALKTLNQKNTLHLLSLRRNPSALEIQVAHLGLTKFFENIFSGHGETKEETLAKKADIIKSTGVDPAHTVVIGDTEADITAATLLGATSICVTSGIRSASFLEKYNPDYIVDGIMSAAILQF